jgi:hypothetical protein
VILVIFFLLHSIATHFPVRHLFSPALEVFPGQFWIQCLVSSGCEDTTSVFVVVLSGSAFILTSQLPISAVQSVPKSSGTALAALPDA